MAGLKNYIISFILYIELISLCQATSKNVTKEIFGDELNYLPVAFGDFNSDKLTDLLVITSNRKTLFVLLAEGEELFSKPFSSHIYFKMPSKIDKRRLTCTLNNKIIESVIPGDFDGDGGMDVFVLTSKIDTQDESYQGFVLWGDHDEDAGKHSLICQDESMEENKHHKVLMTSYPLLIDYNGDYVADLFGSLNKSNANESRCIWKYSEDRTVKPKLICLESGKGPEEYAQLKFPHSNAFVDINNDGNADILVTTEDDFEVWINQGGKSTTQTDQNTNFVLEKRIPLPSNCTKNNTAKCTFGQLAFADFDLDGRLDMIFPACLDHESDDCEKLGSSVLYFSKVTDLLNADEKSIFKPTPIDLNFHHFNFKLDDPMYSALYPRIGDINLDGYPDLLIRVSSKNPLKIETHLLLNVDKNTLEIVEPPNSNMHRGFLLQKEIMPEHVGNIVMATFVDLYENGNEDIILVEKLADDSYQIGAYSNSTQDSDAYFVKVIVLSGKCFNDCEKIKVPYGTNMPGQTIRYRTQRPGLEQGFGEIESCAPQLTQTAHNALQLPYTIFGLGQSPNFLDYMFVNVTNATDISKSHTWSQIIPNSQMYIIPYPPNKPQQWEAKLFNKPSRGILMTGLALVATCGFLVLIIIFLHVRERKADLREKQQQANRFHFDGM